MLSNKDPAGLLAPIAPQIGSLVAVPVPGHEHHAPDHIAEVARSLGVPATSTAPDIASALTRFSSRSGPILILGSLYLAGEVLLANDELPT